MTEAELTAERLAALLDAERENTALRTQIAELYKTADAAYRGGYREGAENEADRLRARLRDVAQILIEHTGASGPMDAEEAARKDGDT